MRMATWNQSRIGSPNARKSPCAWRTLSPPSDRNVVGCAGNTPCSARNRSMRSVGLASNRWTKAKTWPVPARGRLLPTMTSNHPSWRDGASEAFRSESLHAFGGLGLQSMDESKDLACAGARQALADHDLEPSFLAGRSVRSLHVPAVDADRLQRVALR